MKAAVAFLLVVAIALAGCLYYALKLIEDIVHDLNGIHEWMRTSADLSGITGEEQDKLAYRLSIAEERILNLTNKTGQMAVKLKKMDANTIYEVKGDE